MKNPGTSLQKHTETPQKEAQGLNPAFQPT
jgi:hypothetical protein